MPCPFGLGSFWPIIGGLVLDGIPDTAFCQTLINKGKPAKVAITAVMRKIIVLANALIRKEKLWTPINA
jgi:hypothetical protein